MKTEIQIGKSGHCCWSAIFSHLSVFLVDVWLIYNVVLSLCTTVPGFVWTLVLGANSFCSHGFSLVLPEPWSCRAPFCPHALFWYLWSLASPSDGRTPRGLPWNKTPFPLSLALREFSIPSRPCLSLYSCSWSELMAMLLPTYASTLLLLMVFLGAHFILPCS